MRMLALLLLSSFALSETTFEEDLDHVLILTHKTYDDAIKQYPKLLIEFYAPWCGHCQALKGPYGNVAKHGHDKKWAVKLAKIDGSVKDNDLIALKKKLGVKGFPSLIYHGDGGVVSIKERKEQELLDLMDAYNKEQWRVATADEESKPMKVMGFFFPDFDSPEAQAFKSASLRYGQTMEFVATKKMKIIKKFKVTPPSIVFFGGAGHLQPESKMPEPIAAREGQLPGNSVIEWLGKSSMSVITELTADTASQVRSSPIKRHLMAFVDGRQENEETKKKLVSLKKKFPDDIIVVYVRVSHFAQLAVQFNVQKLPSFGIADMSKGFDRYRFEAEETVPNLIQFVQNHIDKKLTKYVKSESVVTDSDDVLVKVVGADFRKVVIEEEAEEKDCLMYFHNGKTPAWMMGELREIAQKFAAVDTVIIGTFDYTKNELLHTLVRDVQGSEPSLYMFAGSAESKKNPAKYTGDIEVEEIVTFMKKTLETVELETDGEDDEEEEGGEEEEEEGEESGGDDEFEL